jgi:hypothetical protein
MKAALYILGDADRVREHIERHLLAGELAELAKLSERLSSGLNNLTCAAEESLGAETIMAGGDDVLLRVRADVFSAKALETIARTFRSETGCTISFGVGADIAVAYLNLRRAKAGGGGTIVYPRGGE